MTRRYELAERAADAHEIYITYQGAPEDPTAHARFFAPPVCNKAEPRMRVMLASTTMKDGWLLDGPLVTGIMDMRYVYGLDRWIIGAPQRAHLAVVIKNPFDENDDDTFERLGVKNALIVYDKPSVPAVLMGGVIRKSVYAIRPVLEGDMKNALLTLWHKYADVR